MTTPPRIVCFDWGGVILRICRSFREGCERAGLDVRDISDPELTQIRRTLVVEYQRGQLTPNEYFRRTSEAMAGAYSAEEVARLDHAWLVGEYDGVGALVDELNGMAGIETALLSNTSERHFARGTGPEADFEVISRLTHIHASHLLGHTKPGEEIYRAFERETGAASDEILFFDDLEDNIATARRVGWRSEQIDHTGDTATQMRLYLRDHGIEVAQPD
ncbi:MAG: HAD-IA family hydrolase [Planctomycetota bacterium]